MNSKLLATTRPGLTARVVPLAPLHDQAARIELPAAVGELIGEGANYGVVETTGSNVQLTLGPSSLTLNPAYHNGTKPNPDLRLVRALAIECFSTAPSGPEAWTGDAAFSRTFGYIADAGEANAYQTAAASLLTSWNPHEVFTVGDFSYSVEAGGGTGLNADLAAFNALIAAGKLWPILGNHEWDAAGIMALLDAKVPYATAFPALSYYDKLITDEDGVPFAHILFLDGGRKTNWTAIGAGTTGGAGPGSAQWACMLGQIAAEDRYTARWRIAATETLHGALGDVVAAWKDGARHCATRLTLTPQSLTWDVYDLADAESPVRTRSVSPRPSRPVGSYGVPLRDAVSGVSSDEKCQFTMQAGDSVLLKWPEGLALTGNAAGLSITGNLTARHTRLRAIAIGF